MRNRKTGITDRFDAHHGPVTGISFHLAKGNVDFSDLFLTSSTDWTVKLWNRKTLKCLNSFEDATDYVNDVKWCPSHPALFATADSSGWVSTWNLNEQLEVPIVKTQLSNKAINKLSWSPDGQKILVGDSNGQLIVAECGDWTTAKQDEWHNMDHTISNFSKK